MKDIVTILVDGQAWRVRSRQYTRASIRRLRNKLSILNSAIWKIVRHKFYSDDDQLYARCLSMKAHRKVIRQILSDRGL